MQPFFSMSFKEDPYNGYYYFPFTSARGCGSSMLSRAKPSQAKPSQPQGRDGSCTQDPWKKASSRQSKEQKDGKEVRQRWGTVLWSVENVQHSDFPFEATSQQMLA